MTQDLIDRSRRRHTLTGVALFVLIVALALALIVAIVAVSIGMLRTGTLDLLTGISAGQLAAVLCVAIAGIGSVVAARRGVGLQRHD